ncbi:MAG: tyrosine-type recombinase/integrase [Lachnospiraceae bacterium]|nr:tyrosine-type recombinase/integrase [Lachnospiraceae bacterium]
MIHQITDEAVNRYRKYMSDEEYAESTIQKYLRDIQAFRIWLEGYNTNVADMKDKNGRSSETEEENPVDRSGNMDREAAAAWKSHLVDAGYAPVTINAMLSSLNGFFVYLGWEECKVKLLKIQRRTFRDQDRDLSRAEYGRLLESAGKYGNPRLVLLLETICATGIRVSEVKYITIEAIQRRRADISLKGKIRTILLPGKLCKKLRDYAKKRKIKSGEIFITRTGKSMCRRQIWGEMKKLCAKAGVNASKVFPHNLRHLFARTFYGLSRDIVKLADVLGHSSIETTRIYLISTGETHARQMERLGLIS